MLSVIKIKNFENLSKWTIFILTLIIYTFLFIIWLIFIYPIFQYEEITQLKFIAYFIFLIFILNHFLCFFKNPGIIKKNLGDFNNSEINSGIELKSESNHQNVPSIFKFRICKTCNITRPPLASHCKICDNCILEFDHHCILIGNCIGRNNHMNFYIYLISGCIFGIFIVSTIIYHLIFMIRYSNIIDNLIQNLLEFICIIAALTISIGLIIIRFPFKKYCYIIAFSMLTIFIYEFYMKLTENNDGIFINPLGLILIFALIYPLKFILTMLLFQTYLILNLSNTKQYESIRSFKIKAFKEKNKIDQNEVNINCINRKFNSQQKFQNFINFFKKGLIKKENGQYNQIQIV